MLPVTTEGTTECCAGGGVGEIILRPLRKEGSSYHYRKIYKNDP